MEAQSRPRSAPARGQPARDDERDGGVAVLALLFWLSGVQYAVERPGGFLALWLEDGGARRARARRRASARSARRASSARRSARRSRARFGKRPRAARPRRVAALNGALRARSSPRRSRRRGSRAATRSARARARGGGRPRGSRSRSCCARSARQLGALVVGERGAARAARVRGRGRYYGRVRLWGGVGCACGSALAGALADACGSNGVVFALSPAVCACMLARPRACRAGRRGREPAARAGAGEGARARARRARCDRRFALFLGLGARSGCASRRSRPSCCCASASSAAAAR